MALPVDHFMWSKLWSKLAVDGQIVAVRRWSSVMAEERASMALPDGRLCRLFDLLWSELAVDGQIAVARRWSSMMAEERARYLAIHVAYLTIDVAYLTIYVVWSSFHSAGPRRLRRLVTDQVKSNLTTCQI